MSKPDYKCPFTRKQCMGDDCAFWRDFVIENMVTGEVKTVPNCIVRQLPDMLIDIIKNTVGMQAATESFRNEVVKRQNFFLGMVKEASEKKALKGG